MFKNLSERIPLAFIFVAYLGGIILNALVRIPISYWWSLLFVVFIFSILFLKKFRPSVLITLLLVLLGGMNHSVSVSATGDHLSTVAFDERVLPIIGEVEQCEKRSDGTTKVRLFNIHIRTDGWRRYDGRMLLTVRDTCPNYLYGDVLGFVGKILIPSESRNPRDFNYRKYLANHHVYATVYLKDGEKPGVIEPTRFFLRRLANQVSLKIQNLIDESMSGEQAAILKALIVGVRGEISDETVQTFIDSGVIHVLAVSGLHVGYVTLVFMILFGFFRLPRRLKTPFIVSILVFYVFVVDLRPSVMRAVIMASMILIVQAGELRQNIYNTLFAAAFIQMLIDPLQFFDIGFQLSFMAVFSIVYIYRQIESLLPTGVQPQSIKNTRLKGLMQTFLVSLAALLGTLPITIYYFGRVSIISLIANLFVIPLVGLIGGLGFAQVILGAIWSPINIAYGEVQMILIAVLKKAIAISSNIPFASITISHLSLWGLIIAYGILFGFLNFKKKRVAFITIASILILMNWVIWKNVLLEPCLRITFLNVGQGDAALVEFPEGKKMLIDTADRKFRKDYGELVVAPFLRGSGLSRIDILSLSHPHSDHIGGAAYLMKNFHIGEIWETEFETESNIFREIRQIADSLRIPIRRVHSGDCFRIDLQSTVYFLHPSKSFLESKSTLNNSSAVFKLTHGDVDVLFTGDIELEAERRVALWRDFLQSEVIKVPHHGSLTSSSFSFISAVRPDIALVSVGKNNKFNHPSQETLARYDSMGVYIHRTDQNRALVIESDGEKVRIRKW